MSKYLKEGDFIDELTDFCDDCLMSGYRCAIKVEDLYDDYVKWKESEPMSKETFVDSFSKKTILGYALRK